MREGAEGAKAPYYRHNAEIQYMTPVRAACWCLKRVNTLTNEDTWLSTGHCQPQPSSGFLIISLIIVTMEELQKVVYHLVEYTCSTEGHSRITNVYDHRLSITYVHVSHREHGKCICIQICKHIWLIVTFGRASIVFDGSTFFPLRPWGAAFHHQKAFQCLCCISFNYVVFTRNEMKIGIC